MRFINKFVGAVLMLTAVNGALTEDVNHRFIAGCFGKGSYAVIGEDGKVEQMVKVGYGVQDIWKLKNGNVLASCSNGAREFDAEGNQVWSYKTPNKNIEIHTAQPLDNGNVLMLEAGTKRLFEVNRQGEVAKEIIVNTDVEKKHYQFRTARKTKQGTYWLAFFKEGVARELDADGKVIREIKVAGSIHGVIPMPHGGILISTGYKGEVKEFDRDGKLIWHLKKEDLKAGGVLKTGYSGGMQRLANGNTVVSVFGGNPQFYEITPDKKIVWSYYNADLGNVAGLTILDEEGSVLK